MALTARILPLEQWDRMKGTEAERVLPLLRPDRTEVLVIERDGEVVGSWLLMETVHMECLWKRDDAGTGVARALFRFMCERVAAHGYDVVLTTAVSDEVCRLLEHVDAVHVPGEQYAFRVKENSQCHL